MKIVVDREEFYNLIEKQMPMTSEVIKTLFDKTQKHYSELDDVFLCLSCGEAVDVSNDLELDEVLYVCNKCIAKHVKDVLEQI